MGQEDGRMMKNQGNDIQACDQSVDNFETTGGSKLPSFERLGAG